MPRRTTRHPDHDHHPSVEMTRRENANLSVVTSFVGNIQRLVLEYFDGALEINSAVRKRDGTLDGS
jgi:hypothetical protein